MVSTTSEPTADFPRGRRVRDARTTRYDPPAFTAYLLRDEIPPEPARVLTDYRTTVVRV